MMKLKKIRSKVDQAQININTLIKMNYELICHRGVCTQKGVLCTEDARLNHKSIDDARHNGARYIELDVAISSDGVLFIEHDTIKRLGWKIVFPGKLPFKKYKSLKSDTFTLKEVLQKHTNIKYYLELKRFTNYKEIIDKLYKEYIINNLEKYIIHSMDIRILDYAKSKDKRIQCSYIVTAPLYPRLPIVTKRQIDLAASHGFDELGGYIHTFSKSCVEYTKSKGIIPTTGYINNEKQLEKANMLGITKFFTDNVNFFNDEN